MIKAVEDHLQDIETLCRKYNVRSLVLFGSASRGFDFDPATSDIDLIVDFVDYESSQIADQYFGLKEELETAFSLPVHLATHRTIRERFQHFIDPRPVRLYAA